MRPPSRKKLPTGWRLTLDHTVTVSDGGRTLIGGDMARALVVSDTAAAALQGRSVTVTDKVSESLASTLTGYGMAHPDIHGESHVGDGYADQITAIIPVHNRSDALIRALTALGGRFPVIVVDDGSDNAERYQHIVENHHAQLIRLDANQGPAAARNEGIRHATTELVLLVDSDIEVPEGIGDLARHFADPRVGIVAPRIRAHSGPRVPRILADYELTRHSPDRGPHPGLVAPWGRVGWLPSACMLARRSVLADGFSEKMRVGEDVDVVWRVVDKGWHVRYDPSVEVRHAVSDRISQWLIRRFTYGSSAGELGVRHPRHMTPAVFTPVSLAITLLLATLRPWPAMAAAILAWTKADTATQKIAHSEAALVTTVQSAKRTLWGPIKQSSALILRHWFPLTAVLFPRSRHVRRLVVAAAVVDTLASWSDIAPTSAQWKQSPTGVIGRLVGFFVMRRIDDAGYGLGSWWGAVRSGAPRALAPRFISQPTGSQDTSPGN